MSDETTPATEAPEAIAYTPEEQQHIADFYENLENAERDYVVQPTPTLAFDIVAYAGLIAATKPTEATTMLKRVEKLVGLAVMHASAGTRAWVTLLARTSLALEMKMAEAADPAIEKLPAMVAEIERNETKLCGFSFLTRLWSGESKDEQTDLATNELAEFLGDKLTKSGHTAKQIMQQFIRQLQAGMQALHAVETISVSLHTLVDHLPEKRSKLQEIYALMFKCEPALKAAVLARAAAEAEAAAEPVAEPEAATFSDN